MKKAIPIMTAAIVFAFVECAHSQCDVPLTALNGPFQKAIVSTGCGAPVTDKQKVVEALKDLETRLVEIKEKAEDEKSSFLTPKEFQALLTRIKGLSQAAVQKFEAHKLHESLEILRLQLAGKRLQAGYVCFNDFLWILHEAFHPAMHLGRHSGPASQYSDEQWASALSSISRASQVVCILKALAGDSKEEAVQKKHFFIERIERVLIEMKGAAQEKSIERLKTQSNHLRKYFHDAVHNL